MRPCLQAADLAASALVRSLVAPSWALWEGTPYLIHYRELRQTQFDSTDATHHRQCQRLREMCLHAYTRTKFYRDRFDAAGIDGGRLQTTDDLLGLPVLTKADLRHSQQDLISSEFSHRLAKLHRKKTSGSTGVSVEVLVDDQAQQFKRACTLRADEWSGWRLGESKALVWGNPEYLRHGWRGRLRNAVLDRARHLDTLSMNEASMREFIDSLRKRPPSLLLGHAHSLFLLAQFCRSEGGAGFQPKGVISTAMVLHDWERSTIEEVFGVAVTNRYGCEEVSLIACECSQHRGLHINADGIYVEVLRADGTPCKLGESGALVITDLVNRAMPLIRYQIGDIGARSDRACPCGRGLPLLERIEGRVADYVVTPGGELISGISLTENFAMHLPGVKQLQIVQEELDLLRLRIVRDRTWDFNAEATLSGLIATRFGSAMRYQCEFIDHIPKEPSGKYRFCISKVRNPFSNLTTANA